MAQPFLGQLSRSVPRAGAKNRAGRVVFPARLCYDTLSCGKKGCGHMGFWLNQALGLLGSLIVFISVQFNNRRVILAAQAAACLMWIVHYGLLGAMTAATINILSFARSVVFYFNDRKWAQSRAWLWAFLALYIVNTVLTWDGPMSLLPGIAMSMTTVALWTRDMRRTRLLYLTNSPFWFTYDILARSYSCMVIEAIAFVSYVVAVWRFDIKKQPQA